MPHPGKLRGFRGATCRRCGRFRPIAYFPGRSRICTVCLPKSASERRAIRFDAQAERERAAARREAAQRERARLRALRDDRAVAAELRSHRDAAGNRTGPL